MLAHPKTTGAAALLEQVQAELLQAWRELLALEATADWVGDDLDGEDPLLPEIRQGLEDVRARVVELAGKLSAPLVLPDEPDRVLLADLKAVISRPPPVP